MRQNRCIKEKYFISKIKKHLQTKFPLLLEFISQTDKIISGGCSKRRPDFLLELSDVNIVGELDEWQHTNYIEECEKQRLNELYEDLGCKDMIIIRINPDKYINEFGETVSGCFKYDKNFKVVVDTKSNIQERVDKLLETIDLAVSKKLALGVHKLFYDAL